MNILICKSKKWRRKSLNKQSKTFMRNLPLKSMAIKKSIQTIMNNNEHRKKVKAMTMIAQGQSIGGKMIVLGQGMQPTKQESSPYKIIENMPVYFSGHNILSFEAPQFNTSEIHKWGEFYNPCMMIGMPDIGGRNKIYVDTRIDGWYLLWVYSKLDEWAIGPTCWIPDIIAWTPRFPNDSILKAGFRLFFAAAEEDLFYCLHDSNGVLLRESNCSINCINVFKAIGQTIRKE